MALDATGVAAGVVVEVVVEVLVLADPPPPPPHPIRTADIKIASKVINTFMGGPFP